MSAEHDKQTRAIDPATITRASRAALRRCVLDLITEAARVMVATDTAAERLPMAHAIEACLRLLDA